MICCDMWWYVRCDSNVNGWSPLLLGSEIHKNRYPHLPVWAPNAQDQAYLQSTSEVREDQAGQLEMIRSVLLHWRPPNISVEWSDCHVCLSVSPSELTYNVLVLHRWRIMGPPWLSVSGALMTRRTICYCRMSCLQCAGSEGLRLRYRKSAKKFFLPALRGWHWAPVLCPVLTCVESLTLHYNYFFP
jgi:hypothetical protein